MVKLPEHVELRPGEQVTFELPGLGTSGYVWDDEIAGDGDAVEVGWTRGYQPGAAPQPVGVSAPELVTIVGRRPGRCEVRLYQHRRWEPPERVREEHRFSVVVRGDEKSEKGH